MESTVPGKHSLCKHSRPCVENALFGFLRGGVIGLVARAVLTLLGLILKRRLFKNPALIFSIFSKEKLRLVGFLSLMVGLFRCSLCTARRVTSNEKLSACIAGFIAGLPVAIEGVESRVLYSLYLIVRGMDALVKWAVANGRLPYVPYFYNILFIVATTFLHQTNTFDFECMNVGYANLLKRFLFDVNDKHILILHPK